MRACTCTCAFLLVGGFAVLVTCAITSSFFPRKQKRDKNCAFEKVPVLEYPSTARELPYIPYLCGRSLDSVKALSLETLYQHALAYLVNERSRQKKKRELRK